MYLVDVSKIFYFSSLLCSCHLGPSPPSWKVGFSLQICISCDLHSCRLCPSVKGQEVPFILLLVFNLTPNLHSNLANEFEVSSYPFWKVADPPPPPPDKETDCSNSRAFLSHPFFCISPCFSFSFIFLIDLKFHEDKFQGGPIFCGLLGLFQMI